MLVAVCGSVGVRFGVGMVLHFASVRRVESSPGDVFGGVRLLAHWPDGTWQTAMRIAPSTFLAAADAASAMRLIEDALARVPRSVIERMDWILSIPPVGHRGFAVDISHTRGAIRALFAGLEEDIGSLAGALFWVARALSDTYRLRETRIAGRPVTWHLEPVDGGDPAAVLSTGHLSLLASLRRSETIVRRNSFAAAEAAGSAA